MLSLKKILSFQLFLVTSLFFLLFFIYFKLGPNHWNLVALTDQVFLADGWSKPVRVALNTAKWEDGSYISPDGQTLFYAYYPGDFNHDFLLGQIKDDKDIYYSEKPFVRFKKHPLSEEQWSEDGLMMAGADFYYMSDRYHRLINDLYKNGQPLVFNRPDGQAEYPYFCAAQKELYFNIGGLIYVYKASKLLALPAPINDGSYNTQPFLTSDCGKMYFASKRDGGILKIFKSDRLGDNDWSKPELVAKSRWGVKRPTLTSDGQTMFFVQIFKSAKGAENADIFYTEKTK